MEEKLCYFCEIPQNITENLYITDMIDNRPVPKQVIVCKKCKTEYEAFFKNKEIREYEN